MEVVKQYKVTLYYDGYMSGKKSHRNIRSTKVFTEKPDEQDIMNFILDSNITLYRGLKIDVKKEYILIT